MEKFRIICDDIDSIIIRYMTFSEIMDISKIFNINFNAWFMVNHVFSNHINEILKVNKLYALVAAINNGGEITPNIINTAVSYDSFQCVKYIIDTLDIRYYKDSIINIAAENGNYEMWSYFYKKLGIDIDIFTLESIAQGGNLKILEDVRGDNIILLRCGIALQMACSNCDLNMCRALFKLCDINYTYNSMTCAIVNGGLDCVKFLYEKLDDRARSEKTLGLINIAISHKKPDILKWLLTNISVNNEIIDSFNWTNRDIFDNDMCAKIIREFILEYKLIGSGG